MMKAPLAKWGLLLGTGLGLLALSLALAWPAQLPAGLGVLHCQPGRELYLPIQGFPWWVNAELGGQPLPVSRDWYGLRLNLPADLADGNLPLTLELGGLRPQIWQGQLHLDSHPPQLEILSPAPEVAVAGSWVDVVGRADGRFKLPIPLAPGWNEIWLTAQDPAGNRARRSIRVFSDRQAPSLSLERIKPDGQGEPLRGKDSSKDRCKIRVQVQDDCGPDRLRYRLDGGKWTDVPLAQKGSSWRAVFPLRDLAEGTRHLEFEVVDRAGRRSQDEADFLVDSSETFGQKVLTRGARGEDVVQLQKRLQEAGCLDSSQISRTFDEPTLQAVRNFQEREHLPVTGRVGPATLAALGPRVFVNLAAFELVLDRPGLELRRFPIACGAPAFPTPTGQFKVWDKVKDPSWIPPDSPWAAEAQTIPPGPSNPLGTRWIGLDWGGVGIHGTNADWSIGSASSHGCLRMHIADVEELYEILGEGTPVTIFQGGEGDPALTRYWP